MTTFTLPVDQIHDAEPSTRRIAAEPAADASLLASIRELGVLTPVLVRPNGNGYRIIFGRRRLRCAREAGLAEIPVVIADMTDAQAIAADAAENMVRQGLHPLDQWRAVAALLDAGMAFPAAAHALGLDDRQSRRMERLGRLHPDVMAAIEALGLPSDSQLAVIANAPAGDQAAALKRYLAKKKGKIDDVNWWQVADALRTARISRSVALFDPETSGLAWDEDFFAEPGSPEQFTTSDREGFFKLQRAALEAKIEGMRKKKRNAQAVEIDPKSGTIATPKGYERSWGDPDAPKRSETALFAIAANGRIRHETVVNVAEAKAAAKKVRDRGKSAGAGEAAPDEDDDVATAALKLPITKAGLILIAAAKTAALEQALLRAELRIEEVIRILLLALTARNVRAHTSPDRGYNDFLRDLPARLLLPGGIPAPLSFAELRDMAMDMLRALLTVGAPDDSKGYSVSSGDAAEWIGSLIRADDALPRFDTAAFLAHVQGAELKRLATDIGMRASGGAGALRAALEGKLPDWRPCVFGAPVPAMRASEAAQTDDGEQEDAA